MEFQDSIFGVVEVVTDEPFTMYDLNTFLSDRKQMVSLEQVYSSLRRVVDPELHKDIVSMGMIGRMGPRILIIPILPLLPILPILPILKVSDYLTTGRNLMLR
jgi:hypothetical protein